MLTLRLTPYAAQDWTLRNATYVTSDSRSTVTPYAHPMLESLAITDGARTLLVVRERIAGRLPSDPEPRQVSSAEYEEGLRLAKQWPAHFIAIETAPRAPTTVTSGAWQVSPFYVAQDGESLHGSWQLSDLRAHMTGLSPREVARLLIYRPRYSTDTVFRGVQRLTERATATFGRSLFIRYPAPALHRAPRELTSDADVLDAFVGAIDDALNLRPLDPATTVLHLTGGFDSGTIATRAAQLYPGQLDTAALFIIGAGREQQQRRRAELRCGLPFGPRDYIVDCLTHPLFDGDCERAAGSLISPYDDPLYRPFQALTKAMADDGARCVVTGLGGDEMVALGQDETPHATLGEITDQLPWVGPRARAALEFADDGIAPPALINSMTLLTFETTAPLLMRAGVWPVHPFGDPGLIEVGEQLPFAWRDLKQLQRRRLASLGLSEEVITPVERENFAQAVRIAMTGPVLTCLDGMLADGSPLIDDGLVDPVGLAEVLASMRSGPYDEDYHSKLLWAAELHMAACAFL